MRAVEVERVIDEALKNDLLIEVEYIKKNGIHTRRVLEPISLVHDYAHKRHVFWGHCFEHDRLESRHLRQVDSIRVIHAQKKPVRKNSGNVVVYSSKRLNY